MEKLVKSKDRVADYGEVFTAKREVNAMLDLVEQETRRIDSRFLEPACGTGNFLSEILKRKLDVVEKRYAPSQLEFERYAVLAVSSIYGIDILEDNVIQCRQNLFERFDARYHGLYKAKTDEACRQAVRFILEKNIIHGDALSLKTVDEDPHPIVFAEWALVTGDLMKRRDFSFESMVQNEALADLELFSHISDKGEEFYIPTPIREYPPTKIKELGDAKR